MWSSHGGSTDGIGGRVAGVPGGGDISTGGKEVHAGSPVGEARATVRTISGTDSEGLLS